MDKVLDITLYGALLVHVLISGVGLLRAWRGKNAVDRLVAFDMTSTLTIAVLVLLALIREQTIFVDVAIGLAALGFVSTIVLARYASEEELF